MIALWLALAGCQEKMPKMYYSAEEYYPLVVERACAWRVCRGDIEESETPWCEEELLYESQQGIACFSGTNAAEVLNFVLEHSDLESCDPVGGNFTFPLESWIDARYWHAEGGYYSDETSYSDLGICGSAN